MLVLWPYFFMKVAIFIEVPSGRYEIEHRCGI